MKNAVRFDVLLIAGAVLCAGAQVNAPMPMGEAVPEEAAAVESPAVEMARQKDKIIDEIIVGGTYRMRLTTGDILEGIIESKDETSIIIETEGKPYTFRASLIREYVLLVPPSGLAREQADDGGKGISESEILSYQEVLHRGPSVGMVDIRIINGSVFRGVIASIDQETIKLNVEGSKIPIAREVIDQIATAPSVSDEKKAKAAKEAPKKGPGGPYDTVYVVSPETDEQGKPLPPVAIIGKITRDDATGISLETPKGLQRTLKRDRIVRVQKHSTSPYEQKIKSYAAPLFCPKDMVLVDMPPGKPDRPFFKVCVDRYEYPNRKGAVPQGNASYKEAQQACESKGKRLCTAEEWQWACSGLEGYTYPYGWQFDKKNCNTKGVGQFEASGARKRCVGKFGLYDMVGNIFEWVTGADGKPMLMGGPYSKCQTVSPGMDGDAKPQTGFRCCKSN
ncbi:MAG: SUMF1/EgtB/PvdO family nonheme iron enzyme [Chitinivibrionales bacterium]|nr:SUMF1/EgtB/PvdO family nonheme iron enzyme [Chitinivibrionales bacterium]MBD3397294.1 SUMF1/EgtB/PvdO family nonheme iron enzyme [Chitinivibrionales bacterium]